MNTGFRAVKVAILQNIANSFIVAPSLATVKNMNNILKNIIHVLSIPINTLYLNFCYNYKLSLI